MTGKATANVAPPVHRGIDRRTFIVGAGAAAAMTPDRLMGQIVPDQPEPRAFTFTDVVELARTQSRGPFRPERFELKPPFRDLSPESYRQIRFRRSIQLFASPEAPFALDLLAPNSRHNHPVDIAIVGQDGAIQKASFSADVFDFGPSFGFPDGRAPADAASDLSYSGFRLLYPLNSPDAMDEIAVFTGASYFRAVGRNLNFGLSARALAIATADPQGEEFPYFTQFWIEEPAVGAPNIQMMALLDSESVVGALRFDIRPGESTVMETRCRLFPRRTIDKIGIAPLTSMYFFGPEHRAGYDDFRSSVHDSAALQMIHGSGRRLLRPLSNPARVRVSAFQDNSPKGFGLVQRRRDFQYYQDVQARYEKRPSGWIEPIGDWGPGAILLVEIPTDSDKNDNIITFWRPTAPVGPSEEGHAFDYRLHWCAEPPDAAPLARVTATRGGRAETGPEWRMFAIDFRLGELRPSDIKPVLWASGGAVSEPKTTLLPGGEVIRATFEFRPRGERLLEFTLALTGPEGDLSETWMYQWTAA